MTEVEKEEKTYNLFKGKFDKKVVIKGPDWQHDPSGEELEIIKEDKQRKP